ncbi:MAG: hypothetical protein ACPG5T_03455 [Endozoicomonas sp.]
MQQIIARLSSSNSEQVIFTPEIGADGEGEPLPFFAFVDTLRLKSQISSLTEATLPADFDDLDETAQRAALTNVMFVQSHVLFELVLEKDGVEVVPAVLGLINRPPFYHFSLMSFLTDAATWPIAAGVTVKARVRQDGWGGLSGSDTVDIFGSARTEAPSFSTPPQQVVVTSGTGDAGDTGGGETLPDNAVTIDGDPVTIDSEQVVITST